MFGGCTKEPTKTIVAGGLPAAFSGLRRRHVACEALGMTGEYELATYTREAQLYGKERLLEPLPAHLQKQ